MLTIGKETGHKWQLWVVTVLLVLIAILAFLWPKLEVGDGVTSTQVLSQDVVSHQSNPTIDSMRIQELQCDTATQTAEQDVVWRECNPTTQALREVTLDGDAVTPTPAPPYICDCMLTMIPTPKATATPIRETQ
jgi:hypothetical protein